MSNVELIPIINDNNIQAVDGRTLHKFLEVGTKFTDWIEGRIKKYEFIVGVDYTKVSEKKETFGGEQEVSTYIISIDMAKELAMVENNDKGRQARKYFIDVEKKAIALQSALIPMTHEEMMLQVMTTLQSQVAQQKAIAEEAIRTKAYISDTKTAKAMNTASQAVKKVNKLTNEVNTLKNELAIIKDTSNDYMTILTAQKKYPTVTFNWRVLKDYCTTNKLTIKDVPDDRYGSVKSYPWIAYEECYQL